jgi:ABC-type antimicrobial peptide transport system permease subunit
LIPIAAGAIPGIVGAVLSGRLLESLVAGTKSVNGVAYVAAVLGMTLIAAAGIWAATRRIAQLDIMEILRTD